MNDKNAPGYYFDIEVNEVFDSELLSFLLRRIFEHFEPNCDYKQLYKDLVGISQLYSPRFKLRKVNSAVSFKILKKMKAFFENEVLGLPKRDKQKTPNIEIITYLVL
jgi:hypothetical protein